METPDFKKAFAALEEKIESARADLKTQAAADPMDQPVPKRHFYNAMDDLWSTIHSFASQMRQSHADLQNSMASHSKTGHLPPLSPGPMKKLLKAAGMDEDYDTAKKMVSCASRKILEVDFKKRV